MTIFGTILLVLALLCTLLYIPISATIRPSAGPDAMELAGLVFLSLGRWILLAAALTIAATRGEFPWIHQSRSVQWIAVLSLLAASGGMEVRSQIVIADEFPGAGLDFRSPFERMQSFLQSRALPEDQMSCDPTYRARSMLRYWFDRHPIRAKTSDANGTRSPDAREEEHP